MATYLSSFSMRSTWVMIMRRQQYRLRPSWSIASLSQQLALEREISASAWIVLPIRNVLVDKHQVALPQITRHLYRSQSRSCPSACPKGMPTLPQEKHRTGTIILSMYSIEAFGKRLRSRARGVTCGFAVAGVVDGVVDGEEGVSVLWNSLSRQN